MWSVVPSSFCFSSLTPEMLQAVPVPMNQVIMCPGCLLSLNLQVEIARKGFLGVPLVNVSERVSSEFGRLKPRANAGVRFTSLTSFHTFCQFSSHCSVFSRSTLHHRPDERAPVNFPHPVRSCPLLSTLASSLSGGDLAAKRPRALPLGSLLCHAHV